MLETGKGVGLSAPQIGKSLRVIVVEDTYDLSDERREVLQREPIEFYELINPELVVIDNTPIKLMEGCLSIPAKVEGTYRMLVQRASAVRVRGMDKHGKAVERTAEGWHARILQHEVDHLNGVLCIDLTHPRSLVSQQNFDEYWNEKSAAKIERELKVEWEKPTGEERLKLVRDIREFIVQRVGEDKREGCSQAGSGFFRAV